MFPIWCIILQVASPAAEYDTACQCNLPVHPESPITSHTLAKTIFPKEIIKLTIIFIVFFFFVNSQNNNLRKFDLLNFSIKYLEQKKRQAAKEEVN